MDKFSKSIRGYEKAEVNEFLDEIINKVEGIIEDNKRREDIFQDTLREMSELRIENKALTTSLDNYKSMENTLQSAIVMATKSAEDIKNNAIYESSLMKENARANANRVVNESLVKAEKLEDQSNTLRRNIIIYKQRLRSIIETQLELIDEIEKIEL